MTTIYVPHLIESAEQAEALPIGTLAMTGHIPRIARKSRPVQWDSTGGSFGNRHMNGWTALVPIEVEEQYGARDTKYGTVWASTHPRADRYEAEGEIQRSSQYGDASRLVHRLITPWEEA